jgi:hypothetical protein
VRSRFWVAVLFPAACAAGILSAQLICSSVCARSVIGILFGRGELLALVHGSGIYQADLACAAREQRYLAAGGEPQPLEEEMQDRSILSGLIANVNLENFARQEGIRSMAIARAYDVLQLQIQPQVTWAAAMRANRSSPRSLRRRIAKALRAEKWIERQIADRIRVTADECLQYYQAHPETYSQPMRWRACHLFLASPPETPPDVVETKRAAIETLLGRIVRGEKFAELIAVASEDEATKMCDGDLGFFSDSRVPPDFFAAVKNMHVGEISQVVRTRLGFHIIQLMDSTPSEQMTFDQAREEISLMLANRKRAAAVQGLPARLLGGAEFIRTPLLSK